MDGLFCLGPGETITISTVETLYNYPEKTITTSTVDTIPLLAPPRSSKRLPLLNAVILLFTDMRAMQRAGPNAIHQIRSGMQVESHPGRNTAVTSHHITKTHLPTV